MNSLFRTWLSLSLGLLVGMRGIGAAQGVELTSSNLPIIIIDTYGQAIPDEPKITADMLVIDHGPGIRNTLTDTIYAYKGKIGIELRGHSSQMFPKKQYGIETRDDAGNDVESSLLGLPPESDWVLCANYNDKSLMRNAIAYDLARSTGRYASRSCFFELVLNGEYLGVYLLLEKIKRTKYRLNITKMKTTDVSGDNVTGGYIIKNDWEDPGDDGWWSPFKAFPGAYQRIRYLFEYPKAEDIVPEQKAYIESFVTAFETVMWGDDYANPSTGYSKYIDLASVVDVFLVNELARNVDAYRLSAFMHKDRESKGGKLIAGPIWDFDLGFGNVDYFASYDTCGWNLLTLPMFLEPENDMEIPWWWRKFGQDTTFWRAAQTRWTSLRSNQFSLLRINGFIDSLVTYLDEGKERNFQRWPILSEYVWPNNYVGGTYANEIAYLKQWIASRIRWMDGMLADTTTLAYSMTRTPGWNTIGAPGMLTNGCVHSLYPTACDGTLFRYDGEYVVSDTLQPGIGYWLKFEAACTVTVRASPVWNSTLSLDSGWNLISGLSCSVPVGSIADPGGILIPGTLYTYDEGYVSSETLEPGMGYWVKASHAGMVSMECGALPKLTIPESIVLADLSSMPSLVISDAAGSRQTLYWNARLTLPVSRESFSMPPRPAGGGFDVRFTGDYRLTEGSEALISIQTERYPITIMALNIPSAFGERYVLEEAGPNGGRIIGGLSSGCEISIQDPDLKLVALRKEASVPLAFVLEQNYPNPFNPTTAISYQLPGVSGVKLVVYDLLGREVTTLVNETRNAGSHQVEFDGTNLASGVYVYRLTAGQNVSLRKMVLMK